MKKSKINNFLAAGVVTFLLFSGCVSGIVSTFQSTTTDTLRQKNTQTNENAIITCYVSGIPHSQTIPYESGIYLKELFSELVTANAHDSCSADTQRLQRQILLYAEQQGLLPVGMSADMVFAQLGKQGQRFASQDNGDRLPLSGAGTGREMFCNFVATGEGSAFPIIILPRFIPFIMTPIPRLFVGWKTSVGFTSVGGLMSGTGFYAAGQQQGFALGFWGIGFSIFLPPVRAYGMFGYALYAKASAEYMEYYPPNNPPEITATYPLDGATYVPLSTPELEFHISDYDGDLMSYSATTYPDVGGANGNLKPDGTYKVPLSGLKSSTEYTWSVTVSDGKDTVHSEFMFTTEAVAPIVSEMIPADGDRNVPITQGYLRFHLRDPQNDLMNYTVETSPMIGSGSESGVGEGYITVPISDLVNFTTYRWYINVTDGTHWTREVFEFQIGFPTHFDPFTAGWHYRKQITIDHTNIPEDLFDFPVLVNIVDYDLKDKAQLDGDDVLFMNNIGFAMRLNYEIEQYDGALGKLIAWVNITQLSSSLDTTFYMYYGNPTTLSQQDPEKTWDSNYVAVWHFGETSGINVADSTANHFNGTANLDTPVITGQIGNGRYFDMTNSEVFVGTQSAFGGLTSYTVEAWANPKSNNGEHRIFDRSEPSNKNTIVLYQSDTLLSLLTNNQDYCDFTNAFSVDVWTRAAGVFSSSGGESVVYKNGVKGTPITTTQTSPTAGSITIYIGRACVSSSSSYRWYGTIDEVRFSNIARSSAWINVSYHNQNDPLAFLDVGSEEPHP